MKRYIGTVARGVRAPIVKEGDDLVEIVFTSVKNAMESEDFTANDKDVVCVTESLLARAQGNYATVDEIAKDMAEKFPGDIGIVFPILSRNRFATLLHAFAKTGRKLHILLAYPSDEVGNHLMDERELYGLKINPYTDVIEESQYREIFGEEVQHPFTGIDYVRLYKEIAPHSEIHFSNDPKVILNYTKDALICSTHTRDDVRQEILDAGGERVYTLADILNAPVDGGGFNEEFGLLGSNRAGDDKVKLFPRDGEEFVYALKEKLDAYTGKNIEVMIYGDGAFKDPVGKIWELADPVVSPAYTRGLIGTPNELKMKYIADTELVGMSPEEAEKAIEARINAKEASLLGLDDTLGTTPRRLTDLIGSLADLTSGSGDKGTPIVYIQGYFDSYASK